MMGHRDGSTPESSPIPAEALAQHRMLVLLAARTALHLADKIGLAGCDVRESDAVPGPVTLEQLAAVIAVGGPSGVLAVFSVSVALKAALLRNLAAALVCPDDEIEPLRERALAEIANVTAGNWIAGLAASSARIAMTPPAVIEGARRIDHVPDATFRTICITTDVGPLSVDPIGRQDLFDPPCDAD